MVVSAVITALVLFGVGAYNARVTVGHPTRRGLDMTAIGAVRTLLRVPAVP
jgi:VIT1/CCC1 family predicted Fe2+/Mn2+ transporter